MKVIKPGIILLHGALGSSKTFQSFVPVLSNFFDTHYFDFRGHGIYADDETINAELLCDELIAYIEKSALKNVTVFGYSMGGYIALMSCAKRPKLFGKIITLATKFEWNELVAAHEIEQLDMIINLTAEHPFKQQLATYHLEKNITKCIHSVSSLMNDLSRNKYLNSVTFSKINNQVLLLLGSEDKMVTLEETTFALNHLPNAQLLVIPDTKHPFEKVSKITLWELIQKFAC